MATKIVRRHVPRRCLQHRPSSRSVKINGRFINLNALSQVLGFEDNSYLCRIFAGKRNPSVKRMQIIADALMMDVGELIRAIADRTQELEGEKSSPES